MTHKLFVMKKCGCKLEHRDLIIVTGNGLRCPHHPENKVNYIEFECVGCGKLMRVEPRASNTMRCPVCRKAIKTERGREANKKYKMNIKTPTLITITPDIKASMNAFDCSFRSDCLDAAAIKNLKTLPCRECNKYTHLGA